MNNLGAIDSFLMKFADYNVEIKIVENIPGYGEKQEHFLELINSLDTKIGLEIEELATEMETMSKDYCFIEGFKTAIKFMMNCANG